jgi:hypothetical protein
MKPYLKDTFCVTGDLEEEISKKKIKRNNDENFSNCAKDIKTKIQ